MITAPTPSNYYLRASGEAAELITSVFSSAVVGDIESILVVSKDFSSDIEPINELTETITLLKDGLVADLEEKIEFNPLFVPCTNEQLDLALEQEGKGGGVQFAAMGGNPFALKNIELSLNDTILISATVRYHEFDLPAYEEIIDSQKNMVLN